jgi:hypothetical protein
MEVAKAQNWAVEPQEKRNVFMQWDWDSAVGIAADYRLDN